MKTLVTATILLVSLTDAMAQRSAGVAPVTATPVPAQPLSPVVATEDQARQIGDLEARTREMVLVVPGPDLKPEALSAITEDLTVMCRIFDQALYPGARSTGTSIYGSRGSSLGRLFTQQTGRTQGLYLDGYGALFFVQVNFPLVPPAQQKEEPKPPESADRVWSETVNEVRGQEEIRDADETGPAYDAQRVENLKAALVKTLRHAANLRVRPQDQVTVVVGSQSHASTGTSHQDALRYFYFSGRRSLDTIPTSARRADNSVPNPAATLVLRVTKADVDALAAGKLTAEQLAPKVQILWSGAQPLPQAPPSTQPPIPASR